MRGSKLVSELIQNHEPWRILDLKARKWYFSILAASYWAKVDVVDDPENAEYPDYLKNHPSINYYSQKVEDFEFKEKYDLIIAKHIVMFYSPEYVFWTLMQNIYDHLIKWWTCFITYHYPDSYSMQSWLWKYQYKLEDFKGLNGKFIVKDFWDYKNPVEREKNAEHHVWYVVLIKQ